MSSIVEFQVIRRAAEPHGVRMMSVALPRRANSSKLSKRHYDAGYFKSRAERTSAGFL